ncbi:MAG: CoA-binding protein [Chloroflexi bacterium]|nr:CoA-binding protein [Chloroflexota bacterium]
MQRVGHRLERVFNPRTVAVIGSKAANNHMWLRNVLTFQGKVYSVQIDEGESPGIAALGVENYSSLLDIPGPVDYVIVAVPRAVTPKVVKDCIAKGVGGVTLFTSGFAETGTEEGMRLQEEVRQLAQEWGLNLIGPNCMGIFNPSIGLRHNQEQYCGPGGCVGFISQSGTHAAFFSLMGARHGVKVSKSVSYGNAVVLDSPDYVEYLAQDEETRIIAMYIEGAKEGRRLFECLKAVTPRKPVVIWKGGQTEAGARAAASHTASLAQPYRLWQAMVRQAGAIPVESLEETIDVVRALLYIKHGTGRRVGLMAHTGGPSVVITDDFARADLEVPALTQESYDKLASFFNVIGGSYRNPLDMGSTLGMDANLDGLLRVLGQLLDIMGEDANVDVVTMELAVPFMARRWQREPETMARILDTMAYYRDRSPKPFMAVVRPLHMEEMAQQAEAGLVEREIAVFPSFQRAAVALRKMVDYYSFHRQD